MASRLTATLVKSYFQYRCERQVRYSMMTEKDRASLVICEKPQHKAPWAQVGDDFEAAVVAELAQRETILQPPVGQKLSGAETASFMRRQRDEVWAHQLRLELSPVSEFRKRWKVPESVELAVAFPDLVQVLLDGNPKPRFRLIDIKAVQVPTLYHKAQVAYYSLLVDAMLRDADLPYQVDPIGEIWHLDPSAAPGEVRWQVTPFWLKCYQAQVTDFLQRTLPQIASLPVTLEHDATPFHLFFKCEECRYLPHCWQSLSKPRCPAEWDVSAVPGLSHVSKQTLLKAGIRTVHDLAKAASVGGLPGAGWVLKSRAGLLQRRAQALLDGTVNRLPGRMTCLMPPRIDVGLYLLFDQDPVEGRLACLGCLCEWGKRREFTVEVITESGQEAERKSLLRVLGMVVKHLVALDAHNAAHGATAPLYSHLFVYESSEARDLQAALGRHLGDTDVRVGLLNLVRMFPPEPLQQEPEYGGRQHLPATALRSVFDAIYVLPTKVSHDLHRVCLALASLDFPPAEPYQPAAAFTRPFSSRLNIDVCRALKAGEIGATVVEADARGRLAALAGLTRWILADNGRANVPFLRLRKQPFRFQATFDPLSSADLDVLSVQGLLASRSAELAALTELAAPVEDRKQRFRCIGPMRLVSQAESPRWWAARRLSFWVPAECRYTELAPGSFGIVLSDGNPDLLLDPARWGELAVNIDEIDPGEDGMRLLVDIGWKSWKLGTIERLLQESPAAAWYLDQAYADENTPRLQKFLQYLAQEENVT